MASARAVIFDVGNVLFQWHPRRIYERLIPGDRALDAFMRDVVSWEWHQQHDLGRPFAETSAELIARHPEHADLIRHYGPAFNDSLTDPVPGMVELVEELDAAQVPLFAITNFSGEFFAAFRAERAKLFDRFRDIVVSGDEHMVKPDPAIYRLALARFGLAAEEAMFVDDSLPNIESAAALGIRAHLFTDAPDFRRRLIAEGLLSD